MLDSDWLISNQQCYKKSTQLWLVDFLYEKVKKTHFILIFFQVKSNRSILCITTWNYFQIFSTIQSKYKQTSFLGLFKSPNFVDAMYFYSILLQAKSPTFFSNAFTQQEWEKDMWGLWQRVQEVRWGST